MSAFGFSVLLENMGTTRRNTLDDCTLAKLREMLNATERTAPNGPAVQILRQAIERKVAAEKAGMNRGTVTDDK